MDPTECVARAFALLLAVMRDPEAYREDFDHCIDGLVDIREKGVEIDLAAFPPRLVRVARGLPVDRPLARAAADGLARVAGPAPAVPRSLRRKRPANDTRQPMLPGFAA